MKPHQTGPDGSPPALSTPASWERSDLSDGSEQKHRVGCLWSCGLTSLVASNVAGKSQRKSALNENIWENHL